MLPLHTFAHFTKEQRWPRGIQLWQVDDKYKRRNKKYSKVLSMKSKKLDSEINVTTSLLKLLVLCIDEICDEQCCTYQFDYATSINRSDTSREKARLQINKRSHM